MKNPGKCFEEDIQKSVPDEWFCYRLKDSSGSWSNTAESRFTPKNICDFIIFTGTILYLVECKSLKGKSIPFSNMKQTDVLAPISFGEPVNIYAVFFINFRELNETYLIDAHECYRIKYNLTRKSLPVSLLRERHTPIPQQLKRTRYKYDLEAIL